MQALSIFIGSCLSAGILSAQTVGLTVNTDTVLHSIDPKIYGQSLDPSHGIWGDVVRNRSFENSLTQGAWKINGVVTRIVEKGELTRGPRLYPANPLG